MYCTKTALLGESSVTKKKSAATKLHQHNLIIRALNRNLILMYKHSAAVKKSVFLLHHSVCTVKLLLYNLCSSWESAEPDSQKAGTA